MVNKFSLICLAIAIPSIPLRADDDQGKVKVLMHAFLAEISRMNPYLNSESAFRSEKGKEVVRSSLNALEKKVQNSPPDLIKNSAGFRITYDLLSDHVL